MNNDNGSVNYDGSYVAGIHRRIVVLLLSHRERRCVGRLTSSHYRRSRIRTARLDK